MTRFRSQLHRACLATAFWCGLQCLATAQARFPSTASLSRDLDGVIQPVNDVEVASTEMGILTKVWVRPGDRVVAGQALAELESESILAQIRVKQTEAESTGKIDQARAEFELQQAKYELLTKLMRDGKASQNEVDRANLDMLIARGRLQSEEESVRVLKADLARVEKQLKNRTIYAPIDGIVTDVVKEPGEILATNSPILLRMIDPTKLKATFSVQESELVSVAVGTTLRLSLSNGSIVEGVVDYVPPVADPETGWFMINVAISNLDGKIIGSRCQRVP